MAKAELDIRAQIKNLQVGISQAQKGLKDLQGQSEKTNKKMQQNMKETGRFASDLKSTFTSVFAIGTAVTLAKQILNVRVEFEKFNAMLKVALGSAEAANREFDKIQRFAANTPFSVRELTDSFVRLVNQGFKPTTEQMKAMGDLAAAMGKDFTQLAEAIIDAQVGEFERLKEFGIRASKEGDRVTLSFKGVEKQMDFTAEAIQDAIIEFGAMEGVAGTMEEISATLGGQISNLGDAVTTLADKLGEMGSEEVGTGISTLKSLVEIMTSLIELKPDISPESKGVIGFLSKVNKGIKTYLGTVIPGSTKEGRQLVSQLLGDLSDDLQEISEKNEENIEDEKEKNDVVIKEIETIETLQKKLKGLQKERQSLNAYDLEAIANKNAEIDLIKNQIEELNKLGTIKALQKVEIKTEDLTIDDDFEEREKERAEKQKLIQEQLDADILRSQEERVRKEEALIQQEILLQQGKVEAVMAGLDLIAAANRDNAKIQQIVSIAQAIINGALGITKTAAELGYPAAIPFQIALGLQTLAQIATIRSQKFERGGYDVLKGRRHAQGGIDIGIGEAEAGEGVAVFSRKATQKYGEFLPAFVKAINEDKASVTESGSYSFNYDDSRQVGKLEDIRKLLSKPDVYYERGYKIISRNGQTTKVKA